MFPRKDYSSNSELHKEDFIDHAYLYLDKDVQEAWSKVKISNRFDYYYGGCYRLIIYLNVNNLTIPTAVFDEGQNKWTFFEAAENGYLINCQKLRYLKLFKLKAFL